MGGLVLNDRYRLGERLATGGMGEVWEAQDLLLNRAVAVKLLKREYVSDDVSRRRFLAEARYAAALQHVGIAQVYDFGDEDERVYLVMELVQGRPLSQLLARGGRLDPVSALDLIAQAARALDVAHRAAIVHRDIKPANLMVTADGQVKITDFGIARGGDVGAMTQTGLVMGTAQYISPEQAAGSEITPAADLYSLGVVAFECLAGRPPFTADSVVALALKHVREEPPPLPAEVPGQLRSFVDSMLAKDPAARPSGAREVADRAYLIQRSLRFGEPTEPVQPAEPAGSTATTPAPGRSGPITQPRTGPATRATSVTPEMFEDTYDDRKRLGSRVILASAGVAIALIAGVFVVGALWPDGGQTKLMNGNGVRPADGAPHTSHPRRTPVAGPARRSASPIPEARPTHDHKPGSATVSTPTAIPTKTRKSPKPTPTTSATKPAPPPTTPAPTNTANGG